MREAGRWRGVGGNGGKPKKGSKGSRQFPSFLSRSRLKLGRPETQAPIPHSHSLPSPPPISTRPPRSIRIYDHFSDDPEPPLTNNPTFKPILKSRCRQITSSSPTSFLVFHIHLSSSLARRFPGVRRHDVEIWNALLLPPLPFL